MQMPRVPMWLLTELRMSCMMLTGLASGSNAAAALCCAQCWVDLIPLICRGMGEVEDVIARTGGIKMWLTPELCVLDEDLRQQEL